MKDSISTSDSDKQCRRSRSKLPFSLEKGHTRVWGRSRTTMCCTRLRKY